jgi:hypothetical protein
MSNGSATKTRKHETKPLVSFVLSCLRGCFFGLFLFNTLSCGDVVRTGRSPMYLVIDTLESAKGDKPAQFSGGALLSDVLTIVTSGGVCSQTNPCQVIFDDFGQVTLRTTLKDITNPSSPNAPTTNNEVTIDRYRVVYRRTDGHNTQGVDVPYAFDGGVTGTVPADGTLTLAFEAVRHVAKAEAPLAQLRSGGGIIYTIADVTFFGKDRVGHHISVTGSMQVNFGNFADQ